MITRHGERQHPCALETASAITGCAGVGEEGEDEDEDKEDREGEGERERKLIAGKKFLGGVHGLRTYGC